MKSLFKGPWYWWALVPVAVVIWLVATASRSYGYALRIRDLVPLLPRSGSYPQRTADITDIVVHHSAADDQNAFNYADYHIYSRGWPGIGYHYVIDPDGTINQTNPDEVASYHVAGHNSYCLGICVSGNLDAHPMTSDQKKSLLALIRRLKRRYPTIDHVGAHKEYVGTGCPGRYTDIEDIRAKV